MSSLCIDDLSPVSFNSLNVNSFVLTPSLLIHADDSVKSDDLDLSLLACSSGEDNSSLEGSPSYFQSVPCEGVKEGQSTFSRDRNIVDGSVHPSDVQCHPLCRSTAYSDRHFETGSAKLSHDQRVQVPVLDGRQIIQYATLPNSPLHEVEEIVLETGQVGNDIYVENSRHEVFRYPSESEGVAGRDTFENSLLQRGIEASSGNALKMDHGTLQTSTVCKACGNARFETEILTAERGNLLSNQISPNSHHLCTTCKKEFENREYEKRALPIIKPHTCNIEESCTECSDSGQAGNGEGLAELDTETNNNSCRPENKKYVAELDVESSNFHKPQSKESNAESESIKLCKPKNKDYFMESDAELLNRQRLSRNMENIPESDGEPSKSLKLKNGENIAELVPTGSCLLGKGEQRQTEECNGSVNFVQKRKTFRKRKKTFKKMIITDSDSDSSVDLKRNQKKYKAASESSDDYGFDSKSPLFVRRSQRIPKKRFHLDVVDSDSSELEMKGKARKKPSISCSDSKGSQRMSWKGGGAENIEFDQSCDTDNRKEIGCVLENEHAKNQRDTNCIVREGRKNGQTMVKKKGAIKDKQPSSPQFVPVAQIVYHNQSATCEQPVDCVVHEKNKPEDTASNEKKRTSSISISEEKLMADQMEQNSRPGLTDFEPYQKCTKEKKGSPFQEKDADLVRPVTQVRAKSVIMSGYEQTKAATSESQSSPNASQSVESLKSQNGGGEKENNFLPPVKVHIAVKHCARQVSSAIIESDRQAPCGSKPLTFNTAPSQLNNQAVHEKKDSKDKSVHVTAKKTKGSKSKTMQKVSPKTSQCTIFKRKVSVAKSVQNNYKRKSVTGSQPTKTQFVFKVKLKEPVDPLYRQRLRKNGSLHITDRFDQKERSSSDFESAVDKNCLGKCDTVIFKSKKSQLKEEDADSLAKTCWKPKRQKDVVNDTKGHSQQMISERTCSSSEMQEAKAENATLNDKKFQVHNSKNRKSVGKSEPNEFSKASTKRQESDPLRAAVEDSVTAHSGSASSKQKALDVSAEEKTCKEHSFSRKKGIKTKGTHNRQRGGEEKAYNFISLSKAVMTEADAISFCQEYGLLPSASKCPKCGGLLTKLYKIVRTVNTVSVEFRFQCNRKVCKSRGQIPLRNVHWFSKSANVLCSQHLMIFYLFSNQFTAEQAVQESIVSGENVQLDRKMNFKHLAVFSDTVQELYNFCREMCVLSLPDPKPIGGDKCTVVILEARFGKTRYCTKHFPEGQLALGAFCRQTDEVFFVPVCCLESKYVIPVIQRYVKKGTEVQTDNSDIYKKLGKIGYKHVPLNHSQHDLDAETGRCLKHNKDSIWWVKKISSSMSTLSDAHTSEAGLCSSVSTRVKKSVGCNSQTSEFKMSTPVSGSVQKTSEASSIEASELVEIQNLSSLSAKSDEGYNSNLSATSVSMSSDSSSSMAHSRSSSGVVDISVDNNTSENPAVVHDVSMDCSTTEKPPAARSVTSSTSTHSHSLRENGFSTENEWIFALHMAEFLWRRIHRGDKDIFLSFLQTIVQVFPLEQQ